MTSTRSSATQEDQEIRAKGDNPDATAEPDSADPTLGQFHSENHDVIDAEIALRAYQYWQERGCPEGSPDVDWHRAEQDLRAEKVGSREQSKFKAPAAKNS